MSKEKTAFIPKQYFAVVAVLLAIMMSVLDGTIMNIALPTLAHDFDVTPSNAIWIVNAYQLVITMTLLSFASLGDIYGYRRIFLTGISIFAGASLACALSDSFWMLTVSRIIQGFGAACVMSVNTALIRLIYPPQILGRGMGVNAMVVAVSAAAGPSIAGSILALGSWHWLFVINIPLGLAALVIGHRFLPHNPASDTKHKFDKISAIANALTFGLLIYTLEGFAHAENRKFIAIQLVLLIIIGTYFIRRQLKETTPILPVDLLKIPIFALSISTSITSFTAQMLAMVSLPFFMQNILGYSAVQIGLLLTPWPLATILTAPLAGRLVEKVHPGLLGGIGMAIFATGLFTLYLLPPHPAEWNIIWRMALCGMGFGLFQTPNNVTIVSSAPTHKRWSQRYARNGASVRSDFGNHTGCFVVPYVRRRTSGAGLFVISHILCHCRRRGKQYPYDTGFSGRKEIKPRQVVEQKHFLSDKNFLLFFIFESKEKKNEFIYLWREFKQSKPDEYMKKTLLLLFTLLLALSAQSQNSLRLMTYNIKNANGMDDVCDFQRIADVINHIHPEVVALQELDSMTHRSGQKYVLGEIAGRTQMHAYFAPAIDYDGGKYGIGLLTKEIPVSLKTMTLPGREEARALIMAEFDNYIYCCTHLSLTEEDRMASLELIKDFAAAHKKPFFLAGDLNAEPESAFIKYLQQDFQILSDVNQHTFPAPAPTETIDYITALKQNMKGFTVTSAQVVNEPVASDHRPLVIVLEQK